MIGQVESGMGSLASLLSAAAKASTAVIFIRTPLIVSYFNTTDVA